MRSPKKYSFQLLNSRSVRNKGDLITQLMIDYNCSISVITDNWLTIGDSALDSQLTTGGFKVLLANKYILILYKLYKLYIYISHRRGGLALLFSSELISSSTPVSLHVKF